MASPGFATVKSASASKLVLILPVWGQKVKAIGPGALEVLIRSREKEPAGTSDRTAITTGFRHAFEYMIAGGSNEANDSRH